MPTTPPTASTFKTLCAECRDAIAAGNWASAMSKYAQAEAENCALELEVESAGDRVRRREGLTGLKSAIDAAQGATDRKASRGRLVTTRTRHG